MLIIPKVSILSEQMRILDFWREYFQEHLKTTSKNVKLQQSFQYIKVI